MKKQIIISVFILALASCENFQRINNSEISAAFKKIATKQLFVGKTPAKVNVVIHQLENSGVIAL